MRVLGVDPGLSRCGIGVVEGTSHRPAAVRIGVITTPHTDDIGRRLRVLFDEVTTLIAQAKPDAVALERVFFNANVRTAMGVGQAAGIVLLAAEQAGVTVTQYTPTQVKAAVAGAGDADKEQVGFMVKTLLRLTAAPRPADASDALALALCHLQLGAGQFGAGTMSPRLAQALAEAGPGAQVVRPLRQPQAVAGQGSPLKQSQAVAGQGSPLKQPQALAGQGSPLKQPQAVADVNR